MTWPLGVVTVTVRVPELAVLLHVNGAVVPLCVASLAIVTAKLPTPSAAVVLILGADAGQPGNEATQAIEFGTVKSVVNDRIIPLVVAIATVVPAGITLPRASLTVNTSVLSAGGVNVLPVEHVAKSTVGALDEICAADPENSTTARPRTWMLFEAPHDPAELLPGVTSSQLTPLNLPSPRV